MSKLVKGIYGKFFTTDVNSVVDTSNVNVNLTSNQSFHAGFDPAYLG